MFYYDRMYGELRFPSLVRDALDCPGLLRLREVRMANIPFLSFPSFTGVTRYEHSLGVCHLAGLFAEAAALGEKDKIEIMLAALYHDAATPPFGHAVEEVLSALHGYDHEEKLRELIIGKTDDPGGQRAQLFCGRSIKLHKICQSRKGRSLGLDVLRIADLAAGKEGDPLGDVICSTGIDLDNIDNVIRAATAMGIREYGPDIAESLARSFVIDGTRVYIDETSLSQLQSWQKARTSLYGMIYASVEDFSLQSMLKHALYKLEDSAADQGLCESDWNLTDDELIYKRLLPNKKATDIVVRMRLGDVYTCLSFLQLAGKAPGQLPRIDLGEIEKQALGVYKNYIIKTLDPGPDFKFPEIVANVYPEKRMRQINRPICFMGKQRPPEVESTANRCLLGVFTPSRRKWDRQAEGEFCSILANKHDVRQLRRTRSSEGQYPNVIEDER